jgi:hypothetical protein
LKGSETKENSHEKTGSSREFKLEVARQVVTGEATFTERELTNLIKRSTKT